MKNKKSNKLNALLFFLILTYIFVSISEWIFHKYIMHELGIIGKFIKRTVNVDNGHITHHKKTFLNQKLDDTHDNEGLVFNYINLETFLLTFTYGLFAIMLWKYTFIKKEISIYLLLVLIVTINVLYIWCWGSIHTSYHHVYIESNKKQSDDSITMSPLPFFKPNQSNYLYKYLYKYHTLHHLNKGENKPNFNVIFPFADFILGTYKSNVDNTLYFATHKPVNAQERWLKDHLVFEIRVLDNNRIEYNYKNKGWSEFPTNV
jgi:hypothetical protein